MTKNISKTKQVDDLRRRAEKNIPDAMDRIVEMSAPEIQKLVHELNVHQIELEMQNEALRKSQMETAESQYKYSDLYDFAPVGYFTFDKKGHIIESNVTGASLLGAEKRFLAKQPFQRFIMPGYFSIFQSHLQKAHELRSKQTCKLKLTGKDGSLFDALIDTIVVIDGEGKFDHFRSAVTDITEITKAEALRESEIKYRGLYESTHDGIVMTDIKGHIVECNRAFLGLLGYTEKEIRKITYQQTTPAKWHDMERKIVINKILKSGYSDIYEKEYIRKDGTMFPVSMRVWAIKDESGNITGMWGIVSDITERKQSEEKIQQMAYHDSLTGLPNRKLFSDRLGIALAQSQRNQKKVGIAMLDLDKFKDVNDTLGHDVGDLLLKAAAERLSAALRKGDTVARFGGDEFVVIIPDLKVIEDASQVAQRIIDSFCKPFLIDTHQLVVTTSIGIAFYPNDGTDEGILLKNADITMYQAKQAGRARYQLCNSV